MATLATRPKAARLSLVGAASRRSLKADKIALEVKQEPWQQRMWDFYDSLGCVHYGVSFKRNAAAKVAYFVGEAPAQDSDNNEPTETKNKDAIAAVDRLQSRFGGVKEIIAELMVHINVPGEGYLVGHGGVDGEQWDVWSVQEIFESRYATAFLDPDRAVLEEEDAFAARIWRPHPQNRQKADAPLRPVADQCEQLLLLEDSISAAAKSRLPMGLFYVPTELDLGDQTAFEEALIALQTVPIKETDSAARYAPGLLRGPAEYADKLRLISFAREVDSTFAAMREELVRAIAAGLDLPAEIILGKGDLNHWTGWEIDESAFRDHVDPDIILILDSLTRGYLRPALAAAGVPNPEKYLLWRDLSDLGQKPPTVDEAIRLKEARVVNDEYVRDLIGATDADKPTDPEPPVVTPPEANTPVPIGPPGTQDQTPAPAPVPSVAAALRRRPLEELAEIDRLLLERISEATEAAFNRVLERAGAKIRSHARKDRAILATIDRVPNEQVTYVLGERLVAQLQITPDDLVPPDSFELLARRLRSMLASAAATVGDRLEKLTNERPPDNAQKRETAIVAFLAALSAYALRLLFKPAEPGPGEVGDTVVPGAMVADLLTQAGGAAPSSGPSLVRGFATGADAIQWLVDHGAQVAAHRWEYGDASTRQQPFPPHQSLDGLEFDNWDDERLATPSSAQWLSVGHMFPGDHRGCRCLTVPVVIEAAA